LVLAAGALLIAGCAETVSSASPDSPITLRIGFFPNLTHAPALVAVNKGMFTAALGNNVTLETHTFNSGPEAVTAILSDSIDASFMGPNPTTNAYLQSHGSAIRVIAGSTSGGALLVVKSSIQSITALKGTRIADPQLGSTQDIALRWFLKSHGLTSELAGGGDVAVIPQDNSQTLSAFRQGQIDGAWVPEPWASRLIVEGGARVLVDERDLWPEGKFATTNLVVRTNFLRAHQKQVQALIEGLYQVIAYLNSSPDEARQAATDAVTRITGKKLANGVVSSAWAHMAFGLDPLAGSLKASADHAHSLGLLPEADLKGLYDLTIVNNVLRGHGQPTVSGL
jgi:NitT/TauT family transport system substrate-binding protein